MPAAVWRGISARHCIILSGISVVAIGESGIVNGTEDREWSTAFGSLYLAVEMVSTLYREIASGDFGPLKM
jgi:hypothetical protein